MLQLLIFILHFMCLLKLPIPTSLVDRLDSPWKQCVVYYRTALSMGVCHRILSFFSARDQLKKLSE